MMATCSLRSITGITKDGEWGKGEPFDSSVEMGVIRGTDFGDARVGVLENVPIRYIPEHIAARKRLQALDILIETAGGTKDQPTGRTLLVKPSLLQKSTLPLTCASFARFIRIDPTKADPEYVFWLLQSLYNGGAIRQYHTQHTGVARFQFTTFAEREPLWLPHISIQKRIVSILSAYDDLIQNNARRIKILEEMAQRLYREWFVNFRFPGHHKLRMVDSRLGPIPEGWSVKLLGDVATITMGLSPKGDTYNLDGDGTPLINGPVEFDERFTKAVKWTTAPTKFCKKGDLIVCVRGSTTGRYVKSDGVYCLGRGVCGISSQYQRFVDLLFASELPTLLAKTSGSTFPSWTGPQLKSHCVAYPPVEVLDAFEGIIRPMHAVVALYSRSIRNLRTTRDLLLPKLISGEVPVEAADDAAAELMEEIAQPA